MVACSTIAFELFACLAMFIKKFFCFVFFKKEYDMYLFDALLPEILYIIYECVLEFLHMLNLFIIKGNYDNI